MNKPVPTQNIGFKVRHYTLALVILGVWLLLIGRTAYLQIMPNAEKGYKFLTEQGNMRQLRLDRIPAYRGVISDRNGEALAVSVNMKNYWVDPQVVGVKEVHKIATVLGLDKQKLQQKIGKYASHRFMYVAKYTTPKQASVLESLKIRGLFFENVSKRYYPNGEVSAHLTGVTNNDDEGIEGFELAYNHWLSATDGQRRVVKDLLGNVIENLTITKPPKPGKDIRLTLDMRIQNLAYKTLKQSVIDYSADSASAIVVDAANGNILAMINQPSFNPNHRSNMNYSSMRNRVVTDTFEPGSTLKPFSMIAGLEAGEYQLGSLIDTAPGWIKVGNKVIYDPRNYGDISLTQVLKKSSQVGIVKLTQGLQAEQLMGTLYRVGIGTVSGLGLPGEISGGVSARNRWSGIELANLSFGYGVRVNALQLARAYAILANNGKNVHLNLIADNNSQFQSQEVIDFATAKAVRTMLSAVTEVGGTARLAKIDGYRVAGKSGTTHTVGSHGYEKHRYVSLFVGMVPADNPKVITVVIVNNPKTDEYSGGKVAAPIFSKITEVALRFYNPMKKDELTKSYMAYRKYGNG